MEESRKNKKKKSKLSIFMRTFFITLGVFAGAFSIVLGGLNFFSGNMAKANDEESVENKTSQSNKKSGFLETILGTKKKDKVYALLLGTDDDRTRTDTMMLACFDPDTVEVTLVSLPRDSKVTIPENRVKELQEMGSPVPSSGVCKLNEVHHYAYLANKDEAVDYLKLQVEELLGLELDFYVKVDFDALIYLVDEIGGVEFDVPVRMYYWDPTQNLLIDLQPGVQMLDGDKAEQLVRYRGYPSADIMRMKVQQEFVKAFVGQALTKDNIIKNAPSYISAAIKYVETDFNMTELPGYLKYLNSFSSDKITAYTLPVARREYIGSKEYVILDEEACDELIADVFFNKTEIVEQSSEDLRIQVLNGAGVAGLAGNAKELLETSGFPVLAIGDYSGIKSDKNRIFVSQRGMGGDIQKILKNSDIVYDPSLDSNYDIVVVVGKLGLD